MLPQLPANCNSTLAFIAYAADEQHQGAAVVLYVNQEPRDVPPAAIHALAAAGGNTNSKVSLERRLRRPIPDESWILSKDRRKLLSSGPSRHGLVAGGCAGFTRESVVNAEVFQVFVPVFETLLKSIPTILDFSKIDWQHTFERRHTAGPTRQ